MSPTHDLKRVLSSVADAERPPVDPEADLDRARRVSVARARRRFRATLSGVAVVAVLGVGAATQLDERPTSPPQSADRGVRLVARTFDATPYTFDLTPEGWSVQGTRPAAVTIAPDDGSTSSHPDDFRGKLVILFDGNPVEQGRAVEQDGRAFWISENSDYTTVSTLTVAGEPAGVVRIQYPTATGWDEDSMVAFLGSVHVGPLAQHGLG